MNSTWTELLGGWAAWGAFSLMFLGPGYLWAAFTNVADFRQRSRSEQILWSVALSVPLGVGACALLGRIVPANAVNGVFAVLDAIALCVWFRRRDAQRNEPVRRESLLMIGVMALFGVYCLVAVTDVQIGHKLYPSSVIQDWSVRVQMVKAAMRSGVPPLNGLSTLSDGPNGHAPHLRYYYFWYVAVAQLARTFHLQASAALAASCAWAGYGFLATMFLCLKYMLGIRENLQKKCFVALLTVCVLGLDILPTAYLWLLDKHHPYPEMEWWRQDRTPSFLGAVLYAPHHIAGFACLLAGFLVLAVSARSLAAQFGLVSNTKKLLAAATFAGIAFASGAGAALFPTFCMALVLSLWAVDLWRRKDWGAVAALAASGLLALILAHGYLQELSGGSSAATGFAAWAWRNDKFIAEQISGHHKLEGHGVLFRTLARQPIVFLMDFCELGLFTLVLVRQVRRDLLRKARLSGGECAIWALVLGAAIPFFLLTSTATSGPNDLGVDAGFLLRFGLQLWAVPWFWELWHVWKQRDASSLSYGARGAAMATVVLLALGLSAQVYQVVSIRFYYAYVGSGAAHKQMDAFTLDNLGERLYNIREAWRQFDKAVPPSAPDTEAVQFNPIGAMQPAETIYSNHQIAAWDTGCGTSYGGDYASCAPVYRSLLALFGNTQRGFEEGRAANDRQDGAAARTATSADFVDVCRTLHLRAIMAESTDSVWKQHGSWVWTEPVLASNGTVRILACPAS